MWLWIAAFVVSLVAVYFLMPKPEVTKVPEVQEVDIPTVEDGKTIPVLFGTRDTESFNVVWWGDVQTHQFNVSGGDSTWYMDIEDVHGGYRYFLGLHAVLFHGPIDYIVMVKSDDKVAWLGEMSDGVICDIGAKDFYGDKEVEGGFGIRTAGEGSAWPEDGCLEILMGYPDQARNWYLEHNLDGGDAVGDFGAHEVPAFRGVVSAVFNRFYIGNSPQLRKLLFRGERIHIRQDGIPQWYDAKAEIAGATCDDFEYKNMDYIAVYISTDMSNSIHRRGSLGAEVQNLVTNGLAGWTNQVCNVGVPDHFYGSTFDIFHDLDWSIDWPSSYNQSWYGVTDTSASCSGIEVGNRNGTSTNYGSAASHMDAFLENAHEDAVVIHITITDGYTDFYDSQYYDDYYTAGSLQVLGDYLNTHERNIFSYAISYDNISAIEYVTENLNNIQNSSDTVPILQIGGDCTQALLDIIHDVAEKVTNPVVYGLGTVPDMNPAHIIRECITDPDWGMAGDETLPDEDSFIAAADTLYAEGMGISIKWTAQTSIDDFIDLIKKHINAELYTDHATGKKVLKLIRDDYVVADLDTYGEGEIVKVENAKRPMVGELVNSVTVQYWDTCTGEDASVTVQDQALVSLQGGQVNTTIQYPGFTNKAIATRAATRDLRALASQLLTCTIYVNRSAENLNLGSVFVFYWPDLEIDGIVMRVKGIDFGNGRSNTIKLDIIEDVFGLPATVVVEGDATDPVWTSPSQPPAAVDYQIASETPYYSLVKALGQAEVTNTLSADSGAGYASIGAVRPSNAQNAIMSVDSGSGYVDEGVFNFCGTLILSQSVDQIEKSWVYSDDTGIGLFIIGSFAQVEDEFVRIDAIDTDTQTITVGRGVLDTSPRKHTSDKRLFGWGANNRRGRSRYTDSDSINIKVLPTTGYGTLDIADATASTVIMDSRAIRPYPPADLKINGVAYPDPPVISADFTTTWVHRDRTQQVHGNPLDHEAASIGPETGTTYDVVVENSGGVVASYNDISGTSQVVGAGAFSDGNYWLTVTSKRDGYTSWDHPRWDFTSYTLPAFDGTIPDIETSVNSIYFGYDASARFSTGGAVEEYTIKNHPTWLSIAPDTGILSGIPTTEAIFNGVLITGTNPAGSAVSNAFQINVVVPPPAHEYWRIYAETFNGRTYWGGICEIEMRPIPNGVDLCEGGTVTQSSYRLSYETGAYAFDNDNTSQWRTQDNVYPLNQWVAYQFAEPFPSISEITMQAEVTTVNSMPKNFLLEYSDDGVNWTSRRRYVDETGWSGSEVRAYDATPGEIVMIGTIPDMNVKLGVTQNLYDARPHFISEGHPSSFTLQNAPTWLSISDAGIVSATNPTPAATTTGLTMTATNEAGDEVTNTFDITAQPTADAHLYWRVHITAIWNPGSYWQPALREVEFLPFEGSIDQCSGGTAGASSIRGSSWAASKAFDNADSTFWHALYNAGSPAWIRYQFPSAVIVNGFTMTTYSSSACPKDFSIQYSDNAVDWYTAQTYTGEPVWGDSEKRSFSV